MNDNEKGFDRAETPEASSEEKNLMDFFLFFPRFQQEPTQRAAGTAGLAPAHYSGTLGVANGHAHTFEAIVGQDGKINGMSSYDDGHEHKIFGDTRFIEVEAIGAGNGGLHSHHAPPLTQTNMAPELAYKYHSL